MTHASWKRWLLVALLATTPAIQPFTTASALSGSTETSGLVIGTYNVLHCYDEGGNFKSRTKTIANNIKSLGFDVVGVQEYNWPTCKNMILDTLNAGGGNWQQTKQDPDKYRVNQVSVLWNADAVTMTDERVFDVDDPSNKGTQANQHTGCTGKCGGTRYSHIVRFTDRNSKEFIVANVHFMTEGKGVSEAEHRKREITNLTNELQNETAPVFIIGDTNATTGKSSDARKAGMLAFYDVVKNAGYGNSKETAAIKVNQTLSTASSAHSGNSIDQILYKNVSAPSYYEAYNCTVPKNGQGTCGSDHRPVKAVFGDMSGTACTSAADPVVAEQYATWGIGHYGNECTCSESGSTGNNTDYAGNKVLTDDQMKKVTSNKPFYEKSAGTSNIPWQIIAAIHVRESSLTRSGPSNGQGPYQDYGRTDIPASLKSGSGWKVGEYSDEEFQTATDWAAEHIKNNYSLHPEKLATDAAEVKNLFFRYNGQAQVYKTQAEGLGYNGSTEGYEGSPYVMNRADKVRDPTVEPTKSNKTWGQIKTDGGGIAYPANTDYGAYVIFLALGGSTSGATISEGCATLSATGSVKKLQELAKAYTQSWEVSKTQSQTDEYQEAAKRSKYDGGCSGNDCGAFVYILMHESGWDSEYGGSSGQTDHMAAWFADSNNGWSAVEGFKSVSGSSIRAEKLQPGDVLLREGHIYIFVGDMLGDKTLYFASASNCSRSPAYHTFTDPGTYTVYRKNGGPAV